MNALLRILENNNVDDSLIKEIISEVEQVISEQTRAILRISDVISCPFCLEVINIHAIAETHGSFTCSTTCARCKTPLVVSGKRVNEITKINEDLKGK